MGEKMEKVMGASGDLERNKNQNCFSIYLVSARVQNTVKAPTQVLSDDRDAGKREREVLSKLLRPSPSMGSACFSAPLFRNFIKKKKGGGRRE